MCYPHVREICIYAPPPSNRLNSTTALFFFFFFFYNDGYGKKTFFPKFSLVLLVHLFSFLFFFFFFFFFFFNGLILNSFDAGSANHLDLLLVPTWLDLLIFVIPAKVFFFFLQSLPVSFLNNLDWFFYYKKTSNTNLASPVGWGWRIYRLFLCRGVMRSPPTTSALDMTLNNLMLELWGNAEYPFTHIYQPPPLGQDMTQGQFISGG